MLTAILVDDEQNNLSSLKEKIGRHCLQVRIVATCDTAQEAIRQIDTLQPDLVFLDIEMPVMNGFLMLQQLTWRKFELIFTTAYDHYAIKAIRYSALDYLLKPIEIEELKMSVSRAEEKKASASAAQQLELLLENVAPRKNNYQRLAIPTPDGLRFIKVAEIIYLEAQVNYTHIFLSNNQKQVVCRTMKEFEDMLPADTFLRIHNSHIINKNYAERYIRGEGGQVVLSTGVVLDIAKRKKAEFLKSIGF